MTSAEQMWQTALGEIQVETPRSTYETWLVRTKVLTYEDGAFVIGVPTAYARDWLNNRFRPTVQRTLTNLMKRSVSVQFVVENLLGEAMTKNPAPPPPAMDELGETQGHGGSLYGAASSGLNPSYRFDNYVVGSSNRLAHAAAMAVAENPARDYNPLFLYGGVGLGKTHLLQAVGNDCLERGLSVLYVSSEQFTNDLINAIRARDTDSFRAKYRSIDVLLVDDIQFIAGKESTQEEFFHTFNTLHSQFKQVVISSDRSPKSLVTLEDRLVSRFEWGLTADIQPPDIETRIAILRAKAESSGRHVPEPVLDLIARRVQRNIRELQGALNKMFAYCDILNMPLNEETASAAVSDLLPRRTAMSPSEVIETVADYYDLTVDDLTGRSRRREFSMPRQVSMYMAREETDASLPAIGEALGGRDHTTVMHGYNKIKDLVDTDTNIRNEIIAMRDLLYSDNTVVSRPRAAAAGTDEVQERSTELQPSGD